MKYAEIINKVSEELDLPPDIVNKTYKAYWKFIKTNIQSLPLKDDISIEDFSKLRTNFNIPSLGKLVCTYDRMLGVKKRYNLIKQIKSRNVKD
jgi:hypothetical protein